MFQFLKKRLFKNSSSEPTDVASPDSTLTPSVVTEEMTVTHAPLNQAQEHQSSQEKTQTEHSQVVHHSWRQRLRAGLARTSASLTTLFTGTRVDEALLEEIETALISADVGVQASQHLLLALR